MDRVEVWGSNSHVHNMILGRASLQEAEPGFVPSDLPRKCALAGRGSLSNEYKTGTT